MALNFNNFEVALQSKLDTITEQKDMLLLGKAIEATVGNVAVSDLQAEGTTQTSAVQAEGSTQVSAVQAQGTSERNQINAMSSGFATTSSLSPVATSGSATDLSNLRTVGGQSIAGPGGDIATLPAGGSVGQALVKDGSNNASWSAISGGEIFSQSWSTIGSVSNQSTTPSMSFTPTITGPAILGWEFSYRHSATTHCYLQPRLNNTVLHTYGANTPPNNSSWNQGAGGSIPLGTLNAGTTYSVDIKNEAGATINQANDIGNDLNFNVLIIS